ncbi:hypothetical protein ANO14919_100380 [Xylariales sp. No.14919]|nr:acyl-CoA N-acyltransferase [Xylaria grammica]GAW20530.1 hypothetical protein ANO14919_100380 [Xylariales sp. No.14919]
MMLRLHELTTDDEFKSVVELEHEAYSKPFNGIWEVLKGSSPEECCVRQLSWHRNDPSSHWVYITDESSGDVVGAAQWNIYKENPYANGPPELKAYWLPEGPLKQVSDQLLGGWVEKRPRYMSKPHLLISYCFVHSAHRRRGVASLMLKWGTERADKLGLESYVESTEIARTTYEKHGFELVEDLYMDASIGNANEELNAVRKKLECPIHGFLLKRNPVSR